jgi:hypothetical protein
MQSDANLSKKQQRKWGKRTITAIHLRADDNSEAYRLYNPRTRHIFYSKIWRPRRGDFPWKGRSDEPHGFARSAPQPKTKSPLDQQVLQEEKVIGKVAPVQDEHGEEQDGNANYAEENDDANYAEENLAEDDGLAEAAAADEEAQEAPRSQRQRKQRVQFQPDNFNERWEKTPRAYSTRRLNWARSRKQKKKDNLAQQPQQTNGRRREDRGKGETTVRESAPSPKLWRRAGLNPNPTWAEAMNGPQRENWLHGLHNKERFNFVEGKTYRRVRRDQALATGRSIVDCKLVCKIKGKSSEEFITSEQFKVRCTARGFKQRDDEVGKTFSPTPHVTSTRLVVATSLHHSWTLKTSVVKQAMSALHFYRLRLPG